MLVSLTIVLVVFGVLLVRARHEQHKLPSEVAHDAQLEERPSESLAEDPSPSPSGIAPDADPAGNASEREALTPESEPTIPLTGRLLLPPSLPADELAFVALNGTSDAELHAFWLDDSSAEKLELDRAPVQADGSFALDMPQGLVQAWIELEARYLVLEEAAVLDEFEHPAPLELPTLLGGVLRLVFVPGPGSIEDPAVLIGRKVGLGYWDSSASFGPGGPTTIVRTMDSSLAVEFPGLSPRLEYSLELEPTAFAPFAAPRAEDLRFVPGEVTTIEIPLENGLIVAGHVRDESGAAVADVMLWAKYGVENEWESACNGKTDSQGAFRFEALSPLLQKIDIDQGGFLQRSIPRSEIGTQRVREDLDIQLSHGEAISGIVRFPDGRPAEDALVAAEGGRRSSIHGWQSAQSDAEGRFRITGLERGTFALAAVAGTDARSAEASIEDTEPPRARGAPWSARVEDVAAGASGVEVVMRAPSALVGRVLDDSGAAVRAFRLMAQADHDGATVYPGVLLPEDIMEFESEDGSFRWELPGTRWLLSASADGFGDSGIAHVDLDLSSEPIVLTLVRARSIEGTVVDPDGKPVEEASVEVREPGRYGNHIASGSTATDGTFRVEVTKPGPVRVRATHEGFGSSEDVEVAVAAARSVSGLTLQLREGGNLACDVFDRQGKPWAYKFVRIERMSFDPPAQTDANGHLEVAGLDPGELRISIDFETEDGSYDGRERQTVTIVAGQTTHAVLGGRKEVAVVVRGHVTSGGRPLENCYVNASAHGSETEIPGTRTDAEGRFEVELDRGGNTYFSISSPAGAGYAFEREVADHGETSLEFEFPTCGLEGHLLADGPLPHSIQISVREVTTRSCRWSGNVEQRALVHDDGSWTCHFLPPGAYEVAAYLELSFEPGTQNLTSELRDPIELHEGEIVPDIDLHLLTGGTVEGRILSPAGTSAGRARFEVRDAAGRRVMVRDPNEDSGTYSLSGLPPGSVEILCFTERYVSAEPVRVEIQAKRATKQDLVLVPGTRLRLRVPDATSLRGLRLNVRDGNGREHVGDDADRNEGHGALPNERLVGPLPPGPYSIELAREEARVTRTVEVHGEAELVVELELP
jgi:hypothetical protein